MITLFFLYLYCFCVLFLTLLSFSWWCRYICRLAKSIISIVFSFRWLRYLNCSRYTEVSWHSIKLLRMLYCQEIRVFIGAIRKCCHLNLTWSSSNWLVSSQRMVVRHIWIVSSSIWPLSSVVASRVFNGIAFLFLFSVVLHFPSAF
jgi:hypothetical protein